MKKYPILILFLATCLIVLPSFQKKEEDQLKIIERGVEIKVEQFRLRKMRDCKEKALKRVLLDIKFMPMRMIEFQKFQTFLMVYL